jgi:hypothetical protein
VRKLTDLPNIGPAMARDLELIGVRTPTQLVGRDPFGMYRRLCRKRGVRQDPCVLDVFISVTSFMNGDDPKPWWAFTAERKRHFGSV